MSLCCKKALNGAIPVPGPTIMQSVSPFSGRINDLVGDIKTPIGVSPTSHLSDK